MPRGFVRLLLLLVAASSATVARADSTFDADLAACRRLVKDEKWQSAQKAYADLFQKYQGDARVPTQLPSIEDDLKQCQFRAGRRSPKGTDLFGPEVTKFNIDTGDVELVFPNFPSGARVVGDADSAHRLIDLRFDREVTIEAPADGWKKTNPEVSVSAVLCFNLETRAGYFAAHGFATDHSSTYSLSEYNCVVFELGGAKPNVLAENISFPQTDYETQNVTRFVRIARTSSGVRLDLNKRLGVRVDDTRYASGFVGLSAASRNGGTVSVRVKGKLDAVWKKQQIAAFEDKAFREWAEKGYDRVAALPEWLRASAGPTLATPELPSDAPEEVADRLTALAQKVLCDGGEIVAADLVRADGLPERCALFATGLDALAADSAADAKAAFEQLVELEPLFAWGHVALARALIDLRDLDGARARLAAARGIAPQISAVYENLAVVEFVSGDLAAARAALEEATKAGAVDDAVARMTKMVGRAVEGPRWAKSFRYKSPHFDVRSDHSQQLCSDIAMALELSLKDYAQNFRPVPGAKGCARVDVFSSRESYLAFAGEVGADLSQTLGAYVGCLRELVVWCPEDRVEFRQTVRHEAFHQFLHNFLEDAPLWFNEGYAEYFGKAPLDAKPTTAGGDRDGIVRYLRSSLGGLTPIAKLMRMPRAEFMARADMHYPESWALISFLRSTKETRALLERYFDSLASGASPERAYDAAFATDVDSLQTRFNAYLRANL